MKNSPFQKLKAGFSVSIILLLISLALSYTLSLQLQETIKRSETLYRVIHQMDKVLYTLSSCEGNVRGYMITKDEHFIQEYELNKGELRKELYNLHPLQFNNEINLYKVLTEQRINQMDEKLFMIKNSNADVGDLNDRVNQGRILTDSIVKLNNNLENYELKLLYKSNKDISNYLAYTKYVIFVSVLTSIILSIFILGITRKYIQEKQKKMDELNELDHNKNKFFSLISHDLKAPAGRMVHLSTMLTHSYHNNSNKDLKEMILMTQASSIKLKSLVDNLLVWGKSQMGKIEFNPNEVFIHNSVEQSFLLLADFATTKKVRLVNATDKNTSVYADTNMLHTVFRNLVHNAIKYSRENSEVIVNSTSMNNLAEVTIHDTGIGMHPNEAEKLLQMENVMSQPGTAQEEGSGLGLMLCKEFIKRNKGSIRIDSKQDKGTNITVTLPLFSFETLYKSETVYWID